VYHLSSAVTAYLRSSKVTASSSKDSHRLTRTPSDRNKSVIRNPVTVHHLRRSECNSHKDSDTV
jgi:hypothetical protein